MLTFTAQGRIEVYLNGVLISRHVQEREAIESISRHQGIGTYEVIYPKVLVRKVERVSRETFVETGYGYGSGMAVEVVRRIVDTTAPAVGSLTAYGMTTSQVSLTWSDTGASYYELYKSLDGTNWGFLTTTADTVYNDTGLSAGNFYYYRYRAVDQTGNKSSFSATVAPIFPTVPTSLTVTGVTGTTITLDWADNSHPVSNYKVYRSTDGSNYSLIASPSSSTYPDSGLTAGTTYYYKVSAVTAYGESAQSSAVSQATTSTGPDWIQNLPSITFTRGVTGQTFDFYPTYLNTNNSVNITVETGTLPAEIRIVSSPTPRLAYDGTGSGSISAQLSFRVSTTAAADWQSRISGPNVLWYHDFTNAAEVNNFRWVATYGNDPNAVGTSYSGNLRHITSDGITGGCLEIIRPAGNGSDSLHWIRPLSALQGSGNGRGVNDPAASGTTTVRAWNPNNRSQAEQFFNGYYGHSIYHGAGTYDGDEFYVQIRCKMDPNRIATATNRANTTGKFIWFTRSDRSLTSQEMVFYSYGPPGNQGQQNYLRGYLHSPVESASNFVDFSQFDSPDNGRIQPGNTVAQDWYYTGGWDTLLFRVKAGREGVTRDAILQIWAIKAGQEAQGYVLVYDMTFGFGNFEGTDSSLYGHNALYLSGYNNGNIFDLQFYHRYAQVICSKSTIPAPAL